MLKLLLTLPFLLLGLLLHSQTENNPYTKVEKEAISIVNDQLEAYNSQNLEEFCQSFSDNIQTYNYPNDETTSGIKSFRESFDSFFKTSPNLNCEITNRMVAGNKVIDHELITGHSQNPKDELRVIAIYTVKEGLIVEVRFIYPRD